MATKADSLGLAAPTMGNGTAYADWAEWAFLAESESFASFDGWDGDVLLAASARPDRDRACRAAYELRE